jgi:hypothetical protein
MKILPCAMCGSPAVLESTGSLECYGNAWQTLSIECTRTLDSNCGMNISIHADFDNIPNGNTAIIQAWNSLAGKPI